MSLNKIYFLYNLLTKVLLKTLIIFESTYNPSQFHSVVLVLLNQLQMVKYLILPNYLMDNQIFTTTLQFTQYIFRPYLYFQGINEIEIFSALIFSFTLIFFCLWMNLLLIDFQKDEKNNFIISMKNFQQRSTLNVLLANIFKFFILIKSHYLGFIILESAFFMYYNVKIGQIFQIFIASLLIFDIIIIFMLDEYLLTFSLNYYPTYILKRISNSHLSFFIKLIQISQMIIFSSNNPQNQIIQISLCLVIGLLQLYNISNFTIIVDNSITRIIKFNSCILVSNATEQILNVILTEQYQCQQLWILLTILLFRIVTINEKQINFNWNTNKIDNKVKPFSLSYFINQKQFYNFILKTQLSNNNESQINKALFLNQYHQKTREAQHSNSYSKDQHIFQKIDQLYLKQSILDFSAQMSISKFQNSQFYFNYFQILFIIQNHLLILNYCMKIVNQITNTSQIKNHQSFLIKNGISLKYKIFFQYQLQLVQYQLQLGFQKNHLDENNITRKAIQMTQLKLQQQKTINQLLEKSIKIKTNTILDIYIKQKENQEIETIFINSVKEILKIKQQLEQFCSKTCVSSNNCALMFFYLEILNDLITSQQISNVSGQYLGLEERVHDFIKIQEALQYDYSCLKLSIQDEDQISLEKVYLNKNIKISMSNDLSFYQMIPESLSEIHRHYIRHFFQTGKNKYYSQINTSFVLLKQGLITPVQMCMDFLFDFNLRNLQAVTFIRELQDQQYFIILDKEQKITEISVDFYEKILNYPVNKNMILRQQDIKNFIPQLKDIDWNDQQQIKDCQFQFPTYCQISIDSSQHQFSLYFTGTISIETRSIGRKIQYYVIKVIDINISQSYQPMPEKASYFNFVEEQEKIDHPFDFRSDIDQPKHVQYSSRIDTLKPLLSPEIHLQNISEGSDETKHHIKLKKEFQEAHDFGDVGSQQSHVSQVKVSTYYKQFLLIKRLVSSKVFPNHIFKFNIFYTISIIMIMIHIILLLIESQNLKNYLQYISFLSVKYDIFEPILSFLNTRYTILNLQIAQQNNIITENEYHDYITFPTSNLVKGYDDLKISVYYVLSKQEFQQFFEDKYFESTWFEKSQVYVQKNITIRSGILQFLDYQYYFKMAYVQNTLSSETPYFYFSYKNYQNLYAYFSTLSNEMLQLIIEQIQFQKYKITLTSVIIQSLLGFTICFYIVNIIKQRKLKNQIFNCYINLDLNLVNLELNRLRELLYQISSNQIQTFNFDLKSFDLKLSKLEQTYKKNNSKIQPGFSKKYRQIRVYSALQFIIVLINALMYFVLLFITKSMIDKYLDKIQNTAQFYQQFSNLGVNVLIIYSQREVLYRSPLISFFTSKDLELTRNQIHQSLQEIASIGNIILEVNQDDYLFDEQSINLFDQINSESLCLFLPDDIKQPATLICSEVLQGILQKGLVQTINYMHNIILSESQISNFTSRKLQSTPVLELEGATFTSQVIKVLVKLLLENLNFQTNQIKSEFLIVFVIFLIINTFVQIFIMLKFSSFEYQEIDVLRKGIYLLPQQALLFDDHLQRELNNLIVKGNLAQ